MNFSHEAVKKLGGAIRKQRKALGLTHQELSIMAGVGINFIAQIESGKPSAHIGKILDVLHVLGLQLRVEIGKQGIQVSP